VNDIPVRLGGWGGIAAGILGIAAYWGVPVGVAQLRRSAVA